MNRYIDADKLKETLANYHPFTTKQELKFDKIIKIINEEPTVEATEKITGEWIPKEEIKEALEKQIPKQVKKIRHETILGYSVTVYCPFCGGSVWQNADESKYCFRCGQAIDWEVKE